MAAEPKWRDAVICVVLPDAGERYLTSALFEGLFDDVAAMKAS